MICESCNIEHDGSFGSGRFCCAKCARSFSTKAKRSETSLKISQALLGRAGTNTGKKLKERTVITCPCGKTFEVTPSKLHRTVCSKNCPAYKEKLSKIKLDSILANGVTGHYSIRCSFVFQNKEIRCDSMLEYACLDYCVKHFQPIDIERSKLRVQYDFNGETKLFNPDFEIVDFRGVKYIVECKGTHITQLLNERWHNYCEKAELKKVALNEFCILHGFSQFWFDESMHRDFYRLIRKNRIPHSKFSPPATIV